jgi:uncharacterized SAM-binding protein YcdF (DUF218 family)
VVLPPHGAQFCRRDLNVTAEIQPDTFAVSRFRAAKRVLVVFLLLVVACASIWYSRATILRGAAELWIISEPVTPADAIAIFGGGLGVRSYAAAEYYKRGLAQKILISNVRPDRAEMLGVLPSVAASTRSALVNLGVPETAIETFGSNLSNTHDEAVALREWVARAHARGGVIVPTQAFSTRRVRWTVQHEFAGTGIQVQVPPIDNTQYGLSEWWRDEKAIIEFQNEVLKYIYYRLKY